MWWGLKHDIIMKVWFCCTCTTESQFHLDFVLEKKCTMESHFHLVFFFRKKNVQRKCDSVAQCTMESYFCCTFFFSKKNAQWNHNFVMQFFFVKKIYNGSMIPLYTLQLNHTFVIHVVFSPPSTTILRFCGVFFPHPQCTIESWFRYIRGARKKHNKILILLCNSFRIA